MKTIPPISLSLIGATCALIYIFGIACPTEFYITHQSHLKVMTEPNSTIKKLSEITDAGLFERLATDVLRACKPSLYESLSHPGVNPNGKTVKAPLDGVGWVRDSSGNRIIAAAHSTCDPNDIGKKWLHDPSTVKPRKAGGKPTAPEGDLRKAILEINTFRAIQPGLQATVALTSNREPDQESIVAAQQLATDASIDLEIWSASKIAQFLDSPEGQWVRKIYLGDPVEFVSIELLQSCTQAFLTKYAHPLNPEELVDRKNFVEQSSGHLLLVGPSGVGKTTIALQILKHHTEKGGAGLVIPHETVILATSLADAIDTELRKLEPYLQPNAGHQALSLATESLPLVVIIEDANKASDPPAILNKVVGWTLSDTQAANNSKCNCWRLVCPIWPRYVDSLSQQLDKKHGSIWQSVDVYTDEQAEEAIRKRSQTVGCKLLPATVSSIANALGNDPLLIALCEFSSGIDAAKVIETYIEKELAIVASNSVNLHQIDIRDAIDNLVQRMLLDRRLSPSLREINNWFRNESDRLQALRYAFKAGSVLRLVSRDGEEILTPRHDRVLLSLFSRIMGEDLRNGNLSGCYLADPFFAEALGVAIVNTQLDADRFNWIKQVNPLSLFHAFHLATKTSSLILPTIVQVVRDWLSNTESHRNRFRSLRFRALRILAETDASEVMSLTDLFPDGDRYESWCQARFRNGDIGAGLNLLTMYDSFGVMIQGRRELLSHIFARFGSRIVAPLRQILVTPDLDSRNRKGCLLLAGYLGDSTLAEAIHTSWVCVKPSDRDLMAYLWAAARCRGIESENTLEQICDAWAELPDDKDGDFSLSRSSFAANKVSWEFRRYLPLAAIPYFVQRANTDERLSWPITYMMRDFDHPVTVEHIARFLADRDRNRQPGAFDLCNHFLLDGWESRQREHGIQMSKASKARLLELALDSANDSPLRKSAFRVWEKSKSPEDIDQLRQINKTSDLNEQAIWARARRKDKTVISQLIGLIPENPEYWWQAGCYVWSDEMTEALHQSIKNVGDDLKANHDTESDIELILSERLMEIDQRSAERIFLQEWDGLKYSPNFVQAALYFATPQLTPMVKKVIAESTEPAELLRHVTTHMGWKTQGRTGITRFEQVKLICDYADHLSEHDIYILWEICNERGWVDFRRSQLDARVANTEFFGKHRIFKTIDFSALNKTLEGTLRGTTSFWIENHIRNGNTLPELMDGLFDWLEKNRSVKALKILANIFYASARRCDLEKLQRYTETWPETAELMEDLAFSIKCRTLD
ncbi:MAG: ATP-binding protein [Methylobacter sp.]